MSTRPCRSLTWRAGPAVPANKLGSAVRPPICYLRCGDTAAQQASFAPRLCSRYVTSSAASLGNAALLVAPRTTATHPASAPESPRDNPAASAAVCRTRARSHSLYLMAGLEPLPCYDIGPRYYLVPPRALESGARSLAPHRRRRGAPAPARVSRAGMLRERETTCAHSRAHVAQVTCGSAGRAAMATVHVHAWRQSNPSAAFPAPASGPTRDTERPRRDPGSPPLPTLSREARTSPRCVPSMREAFALHALPFRGDPRCHTRTHMIALGPVPVFLAARAACDWLLSSLRGSREDVRLRGACGRTRETVQRVVNCAATRSVCGWWHWLAIMSDARAVVPRNGAPRWYCWPARLRVLVCAPQIDEEPSLPIPDAFRRLGAWGKDIQKIAQLSNNNTAVLFLVCMQ
ncbi:hypothetical protein A0H81_02265 [Grifola frondosa]|uniref:Uncharacterized protein n=1 Tax=Grifola frondosa TaxID=5627 RepID=A0A1C7MPG0_GRIFR|nr:hypothetical protein A0H81_02265 [Grifola frondosa]